MVDCKDCKHCDGSLCVRTATRNGVVLEGARKPSRERADGAATSRVKGTCGTKGRFFEPKE